MKQYNNNKSLNIIYIIGSGHSGSTLLDLVLGQHSKIQSMGEISKYKNFISKNSVSVLDRMCGCGVLIDECTFWKKVRQELIKRSGTDQIDLNNTKQFETNNVVFIDSVLAVAGKSFFLDSTKSIDRLNLYLSHNIFNVKIIHIVRDGRAVTFSNTKKDVKKARVNQGKKHQPFSFYLSMWENTNLTIAQQFAGFQNYKCVRYEDFVGFPNQIVKEILDFIGIGREDLISKDWSENHIISGNQIKWYSKKGIKIDKNLLNDKSVDFFITKRMNKNYKIEIKKDDEYLNNIPFCRWIVITWKTRKALQKFGYSTKFFKKI